MLKEPKKSVMLKYFDVVKTAKQGDVAIWEYGHIAIFDHDKNYFFSQNPNPCKVMQINKKGVHYFRKKSNNTSIKKGDKVKFNGSFLVDKINIKENTWCNYSLIGGKPTKPYHWLPSQPFDNVNGKEIIKPLDKVKNKHSYIVQAIDKPTASARLLINGRTVWVKYKYLKKA